MNPKIIDSNPSPKSQLEWLRVLMTPALLNTLVLLPGLMIAGAMASDSGTPEAIRGSFIAILLAIAYVGAVVIGILVWDKASLFSGILISLFTLANIIAAVYLRTTDLLMMFIPWHELGLPGSDFLINGLDAVVGVALGIVVPVFAIWRLFRHAFELDVVDHTSPVELWDLKKINK